MVELRPGARFQSTVCATEVIVVKGTGTAELTCGGASDGGGRIGRAGR